MVGYLATFCFALGAWFQLDGQDIRGSIYFAAFLVIAAILVSREERA